MNAKLFVEKEIEEIINEPDPLNKNKIIMEKFKEYPEKFEEMRVKLYLVYSLKLKQTEDYGIYIQQNKILFKPQTKLQLSKQKELYVFLYLIENKLIKIYMSEELNKINKLMKNIKKEMHFLNQFKEMDKENKI